jgi:hypothetical protein
MPAARKPLSSLGEQILLGPGVVFSTNPTGPKILYRRMPLGHIWFPKKQRYPHFSIGFSVIVDALISVGTQWAVGRMSRKSSKGLA